MKDKNSPFNIELIGEFSGPFETLIKLFSKTSSYSNIANTQEATIKGKQVTKFSFNSPLSISPFNVLHKNSLLSVRTKISRGLIKLKDQKNYPKYYPVDPILNSQMILLILHLEETD